MSVFTNEARLYLLNKLLTAASFSPNTIVRLATNVPAGAPEEVVFADFDECDFSGYAAISNPFGNAAAINGDGHGAKATDLLTFEADGGISGPQTIRSIYIQLDSGVGDAVCLLWLPVDPPVTLTEDGQQYQCTVTVLDDDLPI